MNRFALGATVLLVLAIGAAMFATREYEYRGSSFEPFPEATDFSLNDQFGNPFRLSDQRGKVVLLFFGYTNCPDVCPATLADYARMRTTLGEKAQDVVFVFISEDPERDTPQRVREFLGAFDASIVGLTGSMEELQPVWDAYFVAREIDTGGAGADSATQHDHHHEAGEDYLVLHTSRVYVIDKQGRLRLTFPYEMSLEDRVSDVSHLVGENDLSQE